jgi:hypothetical protein
MTLGGARVVQGESNSKKFNIVILALMEAQIIIGDRNHLKGFQPNEKRLESESASYLVLLDDLLGLQRVPDEEYLTNVSGYSLGKDAERVEGEEWVKVDWGSNIKHHWRLPDWFSVREYSSFVDYWMKAYTGVQGTGEDAHRYLLFAWISGAANVLAQPFLGDSKSKEIQEDLDKEIVEIFKSKKLIHLKWEVFNTTHSEYSKEKEQAKWGELIDLLAAIFKTGNLAKWHLWEFRKIADDWAVDLALLLAPESGTHDKIVEKFFNDELRDVWLNPDRIHLVEQRREIAKEAVIKSLGKASSETGPLVDSIFDGKYIEVLKKNSTKQTEDTGES